MTPEPDAAVGAARRDALPPNSILSDYRVERVLGSGGFGIVYLARHVELDHQVAIKEYLPTECAVREGLAVHAKGDEYRAAFEEGLSRFRDEAQRLVELDDHPAIVSCRNFFRANGTAYLVMQYAEGEPLSKVLRTREAEGRPFGQADLLNVIIPLLEGLAHVHAAGVIHRDIKPGNIMIRKKDGQPVLIDFGAAKQGVAELSKSMAPFTDGYAAVEQVGDGKLGPWTDIYAVGAVMWRMVAGGNRPWEPPNPLKVESRARAKLGGETDPLPSVRALGEGRFSTEVLAGIENCLRMQVGERIQDCGELLLVLRSKPLAVIADANPIDAPTRSFWERIGAVLRGSRGVFAEIAEDSGTWTQALLVAAVAAVAGAVPEIPAFAEAEGLPVGVATLVLSLITIPAFMIVLALYASMLWLGMKLLAAQAPPYSSTFRVLAFATAPNALMIVPLVGGIVATVYTLVLYVVAISQIARVSIGRAIGIWLTSFFIAVAIVIGVALAFIIPLGILGSLAQ